MFSEKDILFFIRIHASNLHISDSMEDSIGLCLIIPITNH